MQQELWLFPVYGCEFHHPPSIVRLDLWCEDARGQNGCWLELTYVEVKHWFGSNDAIFIAPFTEFDWLNHPRGKPWHPRFTVLVSKDEDDEVGHLHEVVKLRLD